MAGLTNEEFEQKLKFEMEYLTKLLKILRENNVVKYEASEVKILLSPSIQDESLKEVQSHTLHTDKFQEEFEKLAQGFNQTI